MFGARYLVTVVEVKTFYNDGSRLDAVATRGVVSKWTGGIYTLVLVHERIGIWNCYIGRVRNVQCFVAMYHFSRVVSFFG